MPFTMSSFAIMRLVTGHQNWIGDHYVPSCHDGMPSLLLAPYMAVYLTAMNALPTGHDCNYPFSYNVAEPTVGFAEAWAV